MNKDKLTEIGKKLDISRSQIKKINEQRRKQSIYTILVGGIVSLISLITGYIISKNREPRMEYRGYPYGTSGSCLLCGAGLTALIGGMGFFFLVDHLREKRKHEAMMGVLVLFFIVLSVIAVIFGHEIGRPVEYYSGSIEYGVYSNGSAGGKDE